jgi:hypothetical protein
VQTSPVFRPSRRFTFDDALRVGFNDMKYSFGALMKPRRGARKTVADRLEMAFKSTAGGEIAIAWLRTASYAIAMRTGTRAAKVRSFRTVVTGEPTTKAEVF